MILNNFLKSYSNPPLKIKGKLVIPKYANFQVSKHAHNTPSREIEGSTLLSRLAAAIKPRYHFAGMGIHYERQPYRLDWILRNQNIFS